MKSNRLILSGLSALVLACGSAAAAELRTWTDTQGRQVEAALVQITGEDVQLRTADGTIHQFPLAKLSAEDQALAKGMAASAPPAAAPTGTPEVGTGITGFPYPTEGYGAAARQIDTFVAKGIVTRGNKTRQADGLPPLTGFNPAANDEQFVRRVYLDVIGRIPSHDEASVFLKNGDPMKRSKLINQLLDSEGYSSHMFNYLAEVLRVRHNLEQASLRGDDYVNWLKRQIAKNRPWDQMVHAMMVAEGKMWSEDKNATGGDPGDKGAAGYLLRDAGMPLDNLANTLTVFLGTDVACAQCHDHPFAEWTQKQFFEMAAFFGATTTRSRYGRGMGGNDLMASVEEMVTDSGQDITRIRNGIRNFMGANSYAVADTDKNTLTLPHDYKYSDGKPGDPVKPKFIMWSAKDKGNPAYKQSKANEEKLRLSFANWMTHPENPRFAMTIANRLWKRAFGAGVAEPVTNIDDPEASANPELLNYLADIMKKVKFDMKEFQRIILNTRAYQSEATTEALVMGANYYFQGPQLRRMTAEQTWDSYMTLVLGNPEAYKEPLSDLYGKSIDLNLDNDKLAARDVLMKYDAYTKMAAKQNALMGGGLDAAGGDSMMMMGGGAAKADAPAAAGEGAGKFLSYAGWRLLRASELPQPERGGHFLAEFGQSPRMLIDGGSKVGSVPQVLMMMNGGAQEMLTNRQSLIFRAMDKVNNPADKVEALFLSVMNRKPTLQEKDIAKREINAHGEAGYANMIWALINTREFIFIQ
jgi:hypothetical protein